MSTFEDLQQTANDDVKVIVGDTKPSSDETIATNVDLDIARDHLDDVEERNSATIGIMDDTLIASESADISPRDMGILRVSLSAITGAKVIRPFAQEDVDNKISNRTIALEGFKETLKKFWNYIKEQVKKFWNILKRWWYKTFDISKRAKIRAKKLSDAADKEYGSSVENEIAFRDIKKLAIDGRINDPNAVVKGFKDLETIVHEFINASTTDRFNDTVEALSDKTTSIITGVKSLADTLIKARGEDHKLGRDELSIRTVDLDSFSEIVERCFAKTDTDVVNDDKFALDNAEKYLKQYAESDKAIFKHSAHLPGDKWILSVRPATKKEMGYTVDLVTTIEALRISRILVAPCRYSDKHYEPEPMVKVLGTTAISRACDSIANICEYINEYRVAFERRDKFKERIIKDIDQTVNELSEDNESAYAECDRMIRSFANAIIGMIRRRTDFETSLCAYAVSSSVAFLNYAELSLKQYTK